MLGEQAFEVEIVAMGNRFLLGREVLDQVHICFDFGNRWVIRFRDGGEVSGDYTDPDE